MAVLDAVHTPSLFDRLTASLKRMQRNVKRRRGPVDAGLADFLGEAIRPGDKVLQIGANDRVATTFLGCGAFHLMIARAASAEAVEALSAAEGVSSDRLRAFASVGASESAGTVDAVYLAPSPGFAALAAHFRHAALRLKTGGLLLLDGADTVEGGRLYDALHADLGWRLDEIISGKVAIFRKTAAMAAA